MLGKGEPVLVALSPEITEKEKRDLIRRVLQSPELSSSRALQGFLQFITDHALSGDLDAIKEQRIGSEVLGRKDNYDPASDNIVRVRAHELRQKLAKYFDTEGIGERFVITIPKGSYVPTFLARATTAAVTPETQTPIVAAPSPAKPAFDHWRWLPWCFSAILALVLAGRILNSPGSPQPLSQATRDFWMQFYQAKDHALTFVSADAGFALLQDITGQNIELGDYITRKFTQGQSSDPKLGEAYSRLFTSPADLSVALKISEVGQALGGEVRHRYARDITAAELHTGSVVLMGSRRSNPWVGLFEPHMNFVLASDNEAVAPHFRNRSPQKGEAANFAIDSRFDSVGAEKRQMISYAVAALVPNLSDTGLVLILEGLNMEGTAAIGDLVTNPEKLGGLFRKLGHKPGTTVRPFEALMKLTSIPGGFADPEIVAVRSPRESKP